MIARPAERIPPPYGALEAYSSRRYSWVLMPNGNKSIGDSIKEVLLTHLGVTSESLHRIKLGRGAVGKITVIAVAALIAIGAVGLKLSNAGFILAVVAILGIVALSGLACILYVIIKQPEMAVLEGAELVLYKQITLGVKGQPSLLPQTPVPETSIVPESESSPRQGGDV
jgi:hypothetical protein